MTKTVLYKSRDRVSSLENFGVWPLIELLLESVSVKCGIGSSPVHSDTAPDYVGRRKLRVAVNGVCCGD